MKYKPVKLVCDYLNIAIFDEISFSIRIYQISELLNSLKPNSLMHITNSFLRLVELLGYKINVMTTNKSQYFLKSQFYVKTLIKIFTMRFTNLMYLE